MSAVETASRVLEWALVPSGRPPSGDLLETDGLCRPTPELTQLLSKVVAGTGARLRFGSTPLGDARPVSGASLVMAAVIGAAQQRQWAEVAGIVLQSVGWEPLPTLKPAELVARHAVTAPALPYLPPELAEEYLGFSPLTAVLGAPVKGQEAEARRLARELINQPLGRQNLALHFARPTDAMDVRDWRTDLLERWRLGDQSETDFVLSVYEATMFYHSEEALEQAREARCQILRPALLAPVDSQQDELVLRDALSVAEWWGSLWALERSAPEKLRERNLLGYDYREGIRLFLLGRRMKGQPI